MNELVAWLLDLVEGVDPIVRGVLVLLAMALETSVLVGLVVPGDTIVLVAGTAVTSWPEGVALGLAVLAGSFVGESVGFWLGRVLGPRIRTSRLGRRIADEHWARAERFVARRGGPAIFVSRFLPVVHALVPIVVGMHGFAYRRFLAWTLASCAVWATASIGFAAAAAGTFRELADTVQAAGILLVGALGVFVLLLALVGRLVQRASRRHLETASDAV